MSTTNYTGDEVARASEGEPTREDVSRDSERSELLLNLRQQARLRRKLNVALARHALALYKPLAKQDAFHRAGTFRRRMFRAGNRAGKSTCGAAEDVAWLLGERPWYGTDDVARRAGLPNRPVKLLTITTDWDIVDAIWTTQRGASPGKAWKFLPPGFVKNTRRSSAGAIYEIECANGSIWRFDTQSSYDNDPQGAESADWDAIHVDEPCDEDMFKAHARGLIDRGGSAWFTFTPLSQPWVNDYFFPQDTGGAARSDVWTIEATTFENTHLDAKEIESFAETLSPDERECRIYGKPLHLAGLVYKEFSWVKHVLAKAPKGWNDWRSPPADWCVYVQIDPHPQVPHCVLFCAVGPNSPARFYYLDLFEHLKVPALARAIRAGCANARLVRAECDWLAWEEHPIDETCMATELARHGLYVEKAARALTNGILTVKTNLAAEGVMFFAPSAARTLWEIQRYSWRQDGVKKPIDADDHAMECLYRMELAHPVWVPPSKTLNIPDLVIDRPEIRTSDLEFTLD